MRSWGPEVLGSWTPSYFMQSPYSCSCSYLNSCSILRPPDRPFNVKARRRKATLPTTLAEPPPTRERNKARTHPPCDRAAKNLTLPLPSAAAICRRLLL